MNLIRLGGITLMVLTLAGLAVAPAGADAQLDKTRAQLAERFPELDPNSLKPTPITGLYEIRVGSRIAYVSKDGNYLVQGDIYELGSETNLTEIRRTQVRVEAIDRLGEGNMIIFEPENARHTITVFTDIDCGYCRKLHRQIADYNAEGIRVRYLFFPRSGPNTESWAKADSVWCAGDRNSALTRAKSGETIKSGSCSPTPVGTHYSLGESFGIRGTPAIITETGELIPGYVSPEELLEYLEQEQAG